MKRQDMKHIYLHYTRNLDRSVFHTVKNLDVCILMNTQFIANTYSIVIKRNLLSQFLFWNSA